MTSPAADRPTLADIGEHALVASIAARLGPPPASAAVVVGPGDDAAVLRAAGGDLVATTDVLVEGRHFRRDWSSAYDVGRKAAAQSLADVAAMGARPTALLVAFSAPGELPVEWALQLTDGLRDETAQVGAAVVGGDVTAGPAVTIAVTALGVLDAAPVRRSGARAGDAVAVVGRLGWAAAGLAALSAGRGDHPEFASVVAAHRSPAPPYTAGPLLARLGATAMLDVSDGLTADLGHLARASGVVVELAVADLPVDPALVAAAAALGVQPLPWVAGGGDDHALAVTLPDDVLLRAAVLLADLDPPVPIVQVGRVVATGPDSPAGVRWIGDPPQGPAGHEHFRP